MPGISPTKIAFQPSFAACEVSGYHSLMTAPDPVLNKFRAAVAKHFGDRLERIVLFGSRARGDARADSDYDVAIFVRDLGNPWREFEAIAPVTLELLDEHDVEVNALLYPAGLWRHPSSPLMHEIRKDGLDL
ncbi:MAG TPA: nucleotidyltransferase domain-containing protein [Hyphomicrobiaceae bacterium]|jgi:predicted nucleotidyltransferase